jgi:hypothetical protein
VTTRGRPERKIVPTFFLVGRLQPVVMAAGHHLDCVDDVRLKA